MIRVLQAVNIMDRAGLEVVLMNHYRQMDRSRVQFDFLTHRPGPGAFEEEIQALGGRVYHAPRLYPQNYAAYFRYMKALLEAHPEYRVLHSHIDAMSAFPLLAAKWNGIPVRIAHSHSCGFDRDWKAPVKYAARAVLPYLATDCWACGEKAGAFLFGKRKVSLMKNAIDLEKFAFQEDVRRRVREELGLAEKIVVGHVGRFCPVKNQVFLLDVFAEVRKKEADAHLVLVGKGGDLGKIRRKIGALGLAEQVTVLIDRADVAELYQAFDILVMPSLFEGLPVAAVEAQANGLACILSEKIAEEAVLAGNVQRLSLDLGPEGWAERILAMDYARNVGAAEELREKGYDITLEARKLQMWYEAMEERVKT